MGPWGAVIHGRQQMALKDKPEAHPLGSAFIIRQGLFEKAELCQ